MKGIFENIGDWLSHIWKVKECKNINNFGVKVDTILVTDGNFGAVGLVAFYEDGCRYPQYVTIPFSTKVNVTAGTLVPAENTKVMTLEKDNQLIYRLI